MALPESSLSWMAYCQTTLQQSLRSHRDFEGRPFIEGSDGQNTYFYIFYKVRYLDKSHVQNLKLHGTDNGPPKTYYCRVGWTVGHLDQDLSRRSSKYSIILA